MATYKTQADILAAIGRGEITTEQGFALADRIARDEERAKAAKAAEKPLYCQVAEKGGISVYGLQRMPVTLYLEQWDRLAQFIPTVLSHGIKCLHKPDPKTGHSLGTKNPERIAALVARAKAA